jgi:transposase-like protein
MRSNSTDPVGIPVTAPDFREAAQSLRWPLIRQVFRTEVDLIPDHQNNTLTIRLHPLTAEVHDEVVKYLCEELTSTKTVFHSTDRGLVYEIAGSFCVAQLLAESNRSRLLIVIAIHDTCRNDVVAERH